MALGRPAIATPKALEIRAVGDAISNIRQRIEAIEAQTGTNLLGIAQLQNTGDTQISILRQELDALEARVTELESSLVTADGSETILAGQVFGD